MKISLNWLRDYVQFDASVDEITRAITFLGFEVEQVIRTGAPQLSNVVVCIDESLACADEDIRADEIVRFRKRVEPERLLDAAERCASRDIPQERS